MRTLKKVLSITYLPWLLLLVITNLFFTFLVWLANPDALHILTPVILLFSLILFSFLFFFVQHRLRAQRRAITDFLNNPAPESLQQVLSSLDASLRTPMHALLEHVLEQEKNLEDERTRLVTYREFIEEWTHDIKTPLSLATLVLDNHKDEMSPYVRRRMVFVHQETDVDMILYYARLHATHVEYRFETILLPELLEEVLQNYQEQMEETGILVEVDCPAASVTSDRKVLTFLLSQVLNNAFQYTPRENGQIRVHGWAYIWWQNMRKPWPSAYKWKHIPARMLQPAMARIPVQTLYSAKARIPTRGKTMSSSPDSASNSVSLTRNRLPPTARQHGQHEKNRLAHVVGNHAIPDRPQVEFPHADAQERKKNADAPHARRFRHERIFRASQPIINAFQHDHQAKKRLGKRHHLKHLRPQRRHRPTRREQAHQRVGGKVQHETADAHHANRQKDAQHSHRLELFLVSLPQRDADHRGSGRTKPVTGDIKYRLCRDGNRMGGKYRRPHSRHQSGKYHVPQAGCQTRPQHGHADLRALLQDGPVYQDK